MSLKVSTCDVNAEKMACVCCLGRNRLNAHEKGLLTKRGFDTKGLKIEITTLSLE